MPTFSNSQIPPPANWQDFQTICCDLWREIWKDPNTQENGRQGQPQHGVDVYGRPDQGNDWAGIQCKGKENYSNKSLTQDEVEDEVKKALHFKPKLSQFIIATTGVRDARIQEFARIITDDHREKNLFSVSIWFWDDIKKRLADFPDVLEKHYPGFTSNTAGIKRDIDEIKEAAYETLKNSVEISKITSLISLLSEKIENIKQLNIPDTSTILTSEYQAEIDYSRELLKNHKPKDALEYLESLKSRIWSNTQPIVRYRLLTNIGSARLSLGQEQAAARLFIEALQYNPEDEKALCNKALGHLLLGQLEDAKAFTNKVLAKNPANDLAYSILIQTFSDSKSLEDIMGLQASEWVKVGILYLFKHTSKDFQTKIFLVS